MENINSQFRGVELRIWSQRAVVVVSKYYGMKVLEYSVANINAYVKYLGLKCLCLTLVLSIYRMFVSFRCWNLYDKISLNKISVYYSVADNEIRQNILRGNVCLKMLELIRQISLNEISVYYSATDIATSKYPGMTFFQMLKLLH